MLRILAFSLLFSFGAQAQEWETLFEKGDWRNDLNIARDGSLSCESFTVSGGVVLSVFTYEGGDSTMVFHSERWRFADAGEETQFRLVVDDSESWTVDATKGSNFLRTALDMRDAQHRLFFDDLFEGRYMDLETMEGALVARFSLRGSAATLVAHGECEKRIERRRPADPFAVSAADPS